MKKLIIALLCAFTLFAFASCENGTPAPEELSSNFSPVDQDWWGKWQIEAGTYFVITEDDIVMHAGEHDTVGTSLFMSIYRGEQNGDAYVIRENGKAKYVFELPVKQEDDKTTMGVLIYNTGIQEPTRSTYTLVTD